MVLDITFKLGTNLRTWPRCSCRNRVKIAEAQALPEEVTRSGRHDQEESPSILMCINLISEKEIDPKTGKERFKYVISST